MTAHSQAVCEAWHASPQDGCPHCLAKLHEAARQLEHMRQRDAVDYLLPVVLLLGLLAGLAIMWVGLWHVGAWVVDVFRAVL